MKPFLKWAGGKRQLLPELLKRVPKKFRTYHEPFLGGGALFFELEPEIAVLGDSNPRLIETYKAVRDMPDVVLQDLSMHESRHASDEKYYYKVRDDFNSSDAHTASEFIYLNKTCFNGLWRVNKSGKFNVPKGSYKNPTICDENTLRACSKALQGVELFCGDFQQRMPIYGDFWYADPPYVPVDKVANFTAYAKAGFSLTDQARLCRMAVNLKSFGVHILLSNAYVPAVTQLYGDPRHFRIEEVQAKRAINSKASKRGAVSEAIIS